MSAVDQGAQQAPTEPAAARDAGAGGQDPTVAPSTSAEATVPGAATHPVAIPEPGVDGPVPTPGAPEDVPPPSRPVQVGDDGRVRLADLPRRWWRWPAAALAVALLVAATGFALAGGGGPGPAEPALGPGEVTVELDVEHSLFSPERLRVVEGTRVRFVVVNGDPIGHELIVGPAAVHARHEGGHEAEHPSIPGEVSVGPNLTAVTTYTFDDVGTFEFACHLPGHYEHGMHGEVEVVTA